MRDRGEGILINHHLFNLTYTRPNFIIHCKNIHITKQILSVIESEKSYFRKTSVKIYHCSKMTSTPLQYTSVYFKSFLKIDVSMLK